MVWFVPHSHDDENTVLDLLQELHTLLHREELTTLLQMQREGKCQRSGRDSSWGQRVYPSPPAQVALKGEITGPEASKLGHDKHPGCTKK